MGAFLPAGTLCFRVGPTRTSLWDSPPERTPSSCTENTALCKQFDPTAQDSEPQRMDHVLVCHPQKQRRKLTLIFLIAAVASWMPFRGPRQTALNLQLPQCKKVVENSWSQFTAQLVNLFPLTAEKQRGMFKVCNGNRFRGPVKGFSRGRMHRKQ